MAKVYLSIGSNMGDSFSAIRSGVKRLEEIGTVHTLSSIYRTEPLGGVRQKSFLNCVVFIETPLAPHELLRHLLSIEHSMGRVRDMKNGPRIIDMDILFYDDIVISDSDLVIPHPRFKERRFVLVPLAEIAPKLLDPVSKKTITTLLNETRDQSIVDILGNLYAEGSESR